MTDLTGITDKELRRLVEDLVHQGWAARRAGHGVLVLCPCPTEGGRTPHSFTVGGTVNDKGRRRHNIAAQVRRCPSTSTSTGASR